MFCFLVPPQVRTVTSVVVLKGRSVVLECIASGIPAPSLRWMKDNEGIALDPASQGQLEILSADLQDEGRYVCIGENKGGRANSTVILDVHCKYWSVWQYCSTWQSEYSVL